MSLQDEAAHYDHGRFPSPASPPPYSAERLPDPPQVLMQQAVPSDLQKCKADLEAQLKELKEIKCLEEQISWLQATDNKFQYPVFFDQQPEQAGLPPSPSWALFAHRPGLTTTKKHRRCNL